MNLNRKKKTSNQKYKKAMEHFIMLLKREKAEGETKWLKNAKMKSLAKLRKYRITHNQINNKLTHKGLKDLLLKEAF